MQYDKISEKSNPIFKRKEIVLGMNYNGATPSKLSLQQTLAKEFNTQPNRVEINKILTETGKDIGKVWVRIWQDKEIALYVDKHAPKVEEPAKEGE